MLDDVLLLATSVNVVCNTPHSSLSLKGAIFGSVKFVEKASFPPSFSDSTIFLPFRFANWHITQLRRLLACHCLKPQLQSHAAIFPSSSVATILIPPNVKIDQVNGRVGTTNHVKE